jgi:putative nucleotidyltransferase with HDIG domain
MGDGVGAEAPSEARGALGGRVRRTLVRLSKTGELPTLPGAVSFALGLARDPNADVERLCRAIGADVGIAARALRVANSAIYARRTRCRTLKEVVTVVGLRGIQDILCAAALRSLFDLRDPVARRLWDHALAVSLAAEELGQRLGGVQPGEAFLPGLFHDLGRIVFLLAEPEAYAEISRLETERTTERVELERGWYGFDHADAGATIAADWGLPTVLCDAVRAHHAPGEGAADGRLAKLIALADDLAYAIGLGATDAQGYPAARLVAALSAEDIAASGERVRTAFEAERSLFR